eukprot:1498891-Prorocentrum_lima.AAC.1
MSRQTNDRMPHEQVRRERQVESFKQGVARERQQARRKEEMQAEAKLKKQQKTHANKEHECCKHVEEKRK